MNKAAAAEFSLLSGEQKVVYEWRVEQFGRLGWDGVNAELLANSEADVGEARCLIASGCTLPTALAILL